MGRKSDEAVAVAATADDAVAVTLPPRPELAAVPSLPRLLPPALGLSSAVPAAGDAASIAACCGATGAVGIFRSRGSATRCPATSDTPQGVKHSHHTIAMGRTGQPVAPLNFTAASMKQKLLMPLFTNSSINRFSMM